MHLAAVQEDSCSAVSIRVGDSGGVTGWVSLKFLCRTGKVLSVREQLSSGVDIQF